MRYFLFIPLLVFGGCSKATELTDNVNMSTETILQNVSVVEASTQEIRRNTQLINESTRAIQENGAQMERLKNS